MRVSCLVALGPVEEPLMQTAQELMQEMLGGAVERLAPHQCPLAAFEPQRGQYNSVSLLEYLAANRPAQAWRLLALTEMDLFIPVLSFVYGQAQLDGQLAIVSSARLRQEFYGLPPNPALTRERMAKEVLHELGHTLGLIHCPNPACVMSLSTNIQALDAKGSGYCQGCGAFVREKLRA